MYLLNHIDRCVDVYRSLWCLQECPCGNDAYGRGVSYFRSSKEHCIRRCDFMMIDLEAMHAFAASVREIESSAGA